ncbi:hypothetical protein Apa02nite_003680 [Actinoplanes palleronii]|uniref:Uncharacterized protein n=2 Tax=Actinoplanes palleronii TaxID=113570 RepID=A0ABQ4B0R2_9ACTN|nr:hypothetical protein Apa02nite_003680 [Actinoplanes palleronii]
MSAVAGTLLFLGGIGVVQGVTVSAATAAPVPAVVVGGSAHAGAPVSDRDYRQGYRDGYGDGWDQAKDDCRRAMSMHRGFRDRERDYERGYDRGFDRGFSAGFREYC